MDDHRTHNTLDDLADLFLTGTVPGNAMRRERSVRPGDEDETLDGPPPLRLPPKVAARQRRRVMDEPDEPQTAAPPLRLHRDDDAPGSDAARNEPARDESASAALEWTAPEAKPAGLRVEAVVLGNLPGFGAPWLTQYAHHLALLHGPVGIIHVDDPTIDVEVVGASSQSIPELTGPSTDGLTEWVGRLTARDDQSIHCWLLHLASPESPVVSRLLRHLSNWTILSGADDTAVVAGYRLLKQMMDAAAPMIPAVGLMVVGSDEAASSAAAAKLAGAADNFLHAPVELVGHRKQMLPVERRDVGSFSQSDVNWSGLVALFNADAIEEAEPIAEAEPVDATIEVDEADEVDEVVELVEAAAPEPEPEPEPVATAQPVRPAPVATPVRANIEATDEHDARDEHDEPNLAALLTTETSTSGGGGVALEARCPRQRDIVLLLDQRGILHLLRRQDTDVRTAIADLLEARAWVREHLDLLRLTQRQLNFSAAGEPVLHLFTTDAKTAAVMADRLGATLKLHLLNAVRIGGSTRWISTELN